MDADLLHFLGSQMVELKARPFSYWHCALVDLARSVFSIVHFLATRGHLSKIEKYKNQKFSAIFFLKLKMDLETSNKDSGCLKNHKFLIFDGKQHP